MDTCDNVDELGDTSTRNKDVGKMKAPHVGMLFDSPDEAKEYYLKYGRQQGFTVRIRSSEKSRWHVKRVTGVKFVCSREGEHKKKNEQDGVERNRSCSTVKIGCKACMRLLYMKDINKWKVTVFSDDHNHKFIAALKRMRIRTNKNMPAAAKNLTEACHEENLQVGKVPSTLVGVNIKRDCWNHLRSVSHKLEVGDAQSVIDYFQRMQMENPQFFYAIQNDEDGRATNFFWVDARSRMAHEQFGDFVTFDTTYKTNIYGMPFAPFTGVNHHYQSIQFGCALLQDETEASFFWLFNVWLEAMGGRHPISIITNHDLAMGAAIKKVFPNTRHRLCLWHIKKKIGEKLSIYCKKLGFKHKMEKCIHCTYKVEDFEDTWNALMVEFELNDNEWLKHLYEIREAWVPVYHRSIFFAGMDTTGRSEGVNAFLNDFVSPKTNLREFVVRYEQALKKIIDRENEEDYISEHKDRIVDKQNLILQHASEIYTRNIFEKFRVELNEVIGYKAEEGVRDGDYHTYLITAKVGEPEQFSVKMKAETYEGYCGCQHFEFTGLLCRHMLKVFSRLEVDEIPSHFILKRWMKGANKFRVMDGLATQDNHECPEALRLSHLCRRATQVWCVASKSNKLYKMAVEGIEGLFMQILEEHSQMVACDNFDMASALDLQNEEDILIGQESTANHSSANIAVHGRTDDVFEKARKRRKTQSQHTEVTGTGAESSAVSVPGIEMPSGPLSMPLLPSGQAGPSSTPIMSYIHPFDCTRGLVRPVEHPTLHHVTDSTLSNQGFFVLLSQKASTQRELAPPVPHGLARRVNFTEPSASEPSSSHC